MVINMEWGSFESPTLPRTDEDVWLDLSSTNPKQDALEKMTSGLYMGEVARRLILKLANEAELFGEEHLQGEARLAPGRG